MNAKAEPVVLELDVLELARAVSGFLNHVETLGLGLAQAMFPPGPALLATWNTLVTSELPDDNQLGDEEYIAGLRERSLKLIRRQVDAVIDGTAVYVVKGEV